MKTITAIVKEPGKVSEIRYIPNKLEALQEIVGGYIEAVGLGCGVVMIVNEEGKILDLPDNFRLGDDIIKGTAIFCGQDGDDFANVPSDLEAQRAIARLIYPEEVI